MYKFNKNQFKIRKKFIFSIIVIIFSITILLFFIFVEIPTSNVDISNWKTYRNDEYGFEFKYPEDGELEIYKNKIVLYSYIKRQYEGAQREKVFNFDVFFGKECQISSIESHSLVYSRKILIDMNVADRKFSNGEGGNYEMIFMERKNKSLCFHGGEKMNSGFEVNRSVLSTFKFIK